MQKKEEILNIILSASMIIIAAAAILPLLKIQWTGLPYLFSAGAAGTFIVRLLGKKYTGTNLRIKRLYRIEMVSSICYLLSAFFMFYPYGQQTDWLAFLTAGAVLQVYASFMISHLENKERSGNAGK